MIASSARESPPPSVLFVGSDAYRAGAQIELLHVLRWLSQRGACRPSLLLGEDGDLLEDYERVAPTHVLRRRGQRRSLVARTRGAMDRWLGLESELSYRGLQGQPFDLIYASSAAIFRLIPGLAKVCRAPVVCHVHELEASILKFCGVEPFEQAVASAVGVVAASGAVERTLATRYRVPAAKLTRVYEGIVTDDFPRLDAEERAEARRRLKLPADAFVVGGCGTMDWRKAPDVFLQVARRLRHDQRRFDFVWVGGRLNGVEHFNLNYDALRFGVTKQVHFVGPQANPRHFFAAFDAFLLTSREDPFPLVCLEAASLGLPVLCFEESGGMPEFVEQDAGRVIPYLDVDLAAECLRELAAQPELQARWGHRAADKVRERFDIRSIAPQVAAVIERHAKKPRIA